MGEARRRLRTLTARFRIRYDNGTNASLSFLKTGSIPENPAAPLGAASALTSANSVDAAILPI
jgi:hypothetical protein